MMYMKNYILLDEVTVQTNPDVKKIIRDYDLMTFHHGERFRVVQHCKELEDYVKEREKHGFKQGKIEGKIDSILELLEELGTVSDELCSCIQEEKDMEVLKLYLKKASRVQSIEEFEQWVLKERNKEMHVLGSVRHKKQQMKVS